MALETRIRLRAAEHHHNPGERAECFLANVPLRCVALRCVALRCVASAPWDKGMRMAARPDCSEKTVLPWDETRDTVRKGLASFPRRRHYQPQSKRGASPRNVGKHTTCGGPVEGAGEVSTPAPLTAVVKNPTSLLVFEPVEDQHRRRSEKTQTSCAKKYPSPSDGDKTVVAQYCKVTHHVADVCCRLVP